MLVVPLPLWVAMLLCCGRPMAATLACRCGGLAMTFILLVFTCLMAARGSASSLLMCCHHWLLLLAHAGVSGVGILTLCQLPT